ncbi:tudor domain-containing 6 [Solenopsis invicta]|uniref:tudor domain-containing 6 n=1 Tax=Solenopsis invicta TaxID=13686 RepID=UPI00193CFC5C|nr:tudor domain-containing 6 [Solenopsis invicta]
MNQQQQQQQSLPLSEIVFFVTHVEPDDIYLKIWGQVDKQTATEIVHYIRPLTEQFNRSIIGTVCCARFQNDGFFRAKILDVYPGNRYLVQFIDYGNMEIVMWNEIYLLDNIRGAKRLLTYPPMAVDFTLRNVLPVNGVWEEKTIVAIKKILCYNECRAVVNDRCLIKLWYYNEDFSDLLVKERMAIRATSAPLQDMFRPKHTLQHSRMQLQQIPYQPQNKDNMNNFAAMSMMQSPNMNHNAIIQGMHHKTYSPDLNQHKHAAQPIMQHPLPPQHPPPLQHFPPRPVQVALMFESQTLDVGSIHHVSISYAEDGPQNFCVQIEIQREALTRLMNEINRYPKQPLQEPSLSGSLCLGRYNDEGYKVMRRAIVTSVMEHKCKLHYVDYGNTEVLPYTDIFHLPPEYVDPKSFAINFKLSGLKELAISPEMKKYFMLLVHRRSTGLILHVQPKEESSLIQYGDLYLNGLKVKDILKEVFQVSFTIPIKCSYSQFRLTKDYEVVRVSYVESCEKFFIQLESEIKPLESIMADLAQYAKDAPSLNLTQLKAGIPCAALYDSQWYRAQILAIVEDQVKVVYVDYGNEELLSVVSVRAIRDDLVTKLPAQAIQCALNSYEVLSLNQEVANHFKRLTTGKSFVMKVVKTKFSDLLVDLFEFDSKKSFRSQLLTNLVCDKTDNFTSSRNEEIQPVKLMNEFQRKDKDKYNKNNMDSENRNQNTKFRDYQDEKYQDYKPNWRDEWSPERQQYNNRRERIKQLLGFGAEETTIFQCKETPDENDSMLVQLTRTNLNGTNGIDLLFEYENIPEVRQEPINQMNNLECVNQIIGHEVEAIFNKAINEDSDINKKYSEDREIASSSEIEEKTEGNFEDVGADCILKLPENVASAIAKVLDDSSNKIIPNANTSIASAHKAFVVPELSVEDVIKSMIINTADEVESQKIIDVNLLNEHEVQQIIDQTNANKLQEVLSQIQSIDINESTDMQISKITEDLKIISEKISEDVEVECYLKLEENFAAAMAKDLHDSTNKIIPNANTSIAAPKASVVTELSVEEKIKSTISVVTDEIELQKVNDINLLNVHEIQQKVAQIDANEYQEVLSQIQPTDKNKFSDVQILKDIEDFDWVYIG